MPSLLLLLAAVLLSPKRIYRTTDRCWDSEAVAESQRDWIRKQKRQKKKKKRRKSPTKTSHFIAHTTHASLHGEEEREPEPPMADVRRSVSGTPGGRSGSVLRSATGNHGELHCKNPSRDTVRKKDVSSGKRALKSSLLGIRVTVIIKHKVLVFLMLSHE